jgi:hypothetical protein
VHMRYLGDSYDIVKQAMLRWLSPLGSWSVHPMFTEAVNQADVEAFESLLNARSVSKEILTTMTDRTTYFSCASRCGHLFLDPDTGLRMKSASGSRSPAYLFAHELLRLCNQRPESLTLVFDQSLPRGSEAKNLQEKLRQLSQCGVSSFAYVSHACFVFVSHDTTLVERARHEILFSSKLPEKRLLPVTVARQANQADTRHALLL